MATPNERISQYTKQERRETSPSRRGPLPEAAGIKHAYERAQGVVREHPGYSIMAFFGLGLGLGLLLAAFSPKRERRAKLHEHLGENARETIQNAVARFVPDAVARFMSKRR